MRLARVMAGMVVTWGLLAPLAVAQQGDGTDVLKAADVLEAQVVKLYGEGKYAEAIPLGQRLLAIREKALGPDHLKVSTALNDVALLYEVV